MLGVYNLFEIQFLNDLLAWKYDVLECYNGLILTLRLIIHKCEQKKLSNYLARRAVEGNRNHFDNI
jgi:hypothetical protein